MVVLTATFPPSCSGSTGPERCDDPSAVALAVGACLHFEDAGQLGAIAAVIEREIGAAVHAAGDLLPVSEVVIRVQSGTAFVIPELGFGAWTNGTHEIRMVFNPDSPKLHGMLEEELFALALHELHHVARFRTAGFNRNLLESMIAEGLADHFSVELAGIDAPIWSTALVGSELVSWIQQSESHWYDASYDHDAWFFGTTPTNPRWAGYAIGFELVRRYMALDSSRRASELHGEPASSFVER